MAPISTIAELPTTPGVYALYGGRGRGRHVAYVGIANKLKKRIEQHLVRRDSSVATGTAAAHLNPDYVTEVAWWQHDVFAQRHILEAAEMIAFSILNPALRSRGHPQQEAMKVLEEPDFVISMEGLFQGPPAGNLQIPTLEEALSRISALERRVALLEEMVGSEVLAKPVPDKAG